MTQNKKYIEKHKTFGRVRAVPIFADFTLAFVLQMRKKHGKPVDQRNSIICKLPSKTWLYITDSHEIRNYSMVLRGDLH